jgi:hypothetical protein
LKKYKLKTMSSKKKIFFDTEFTGLHKITTLLSIALVCEDGHSFYAEFTDYDTLQINSWLEQNVLSKMTLNDYDFARDYKPDEKLVEVRGDTELIRQTMTSWLDDRNADIEMWGDVNHWDWILFVSIFGSAFDVPKYIHYMPFDLATALRVCRQDPNVSRYDFAYGKDHGRTDIHNALSDAKTQLEVYKKLLNIMTDAGNNSLEEAPSPLADVPEISISADLDDVQENQIEEAQLIEDNKSENNIDSQSIHDGFVEPTQEMINNEGSEWNPPV